MYKLPGYTFIFVGGLALVAIAVWWLSGAAAYGAAIIVLTALIWAAICAWLFWKSNSDLWAEAGGKGKSLRSFMPGALLKWLPLFITLLLMIGLHAVIGNWIKVALYDNKLIERATPATPGDVTWYWYGRDLEADISHTSKVFWERERQRSQAALQAANLAGAQAASAMPDRVRVMTDEALPRRIVDPGGCRRIIRFICHMINGFYQEWRAERVAIMHRWALGQQAEFERDRQGFVNKTSAELEKAITEGRNFSQETIVWSFRVMAFLSLLSLLSILLALSKAYLYILSRLFLTTTGRMIGANPGRRRAAGGANVATRDPHTYQLKPLPIPGKRGAFRSYLVARRVSMTGVHESSWPPHRPFELMVARMRNRLLLTNRCTPIEAENEDDKEEITLEVARSEAFAEIKLNENDEWLLRPEQIVAFSDNVRFNVYISFRLFTLVFGRLKFIGVRAEGKGPAWVILAVPGGAESAPAEDVFPQGQLLAFRRDARFRISSSLSTADMYLTRVSVSPTTANVCIRAIAQAPRKENVLKRAFLLLASPV